MTFSELQLVRSLVRDSFFDFVREFWGTIIAEEPVFNWHIEYLCNELQTVAERVFAGQPKAYDLIINVPPGSTKSTICSQMFPAWCWTRKSHMRFGCISYAERIALRDSIKTRDVVQSELYQKMFPHIQLREDQNTKGLFVNTEKGERLAVGMGGAITGQHSHFLIVDDPLNPEQSYSEAELKAANRWMETTLPSRKVDKRVTPIILIQQRLHQADPSGEMIEKKQGKGIRHICLPGEITDDVSPPELRERYVEGLLDPVRLPREVLESMKSELGAYGYASQVLQTPVPLTGGMFEVEKIRLVEEPPAKFEKEVRSWDKAGTEDSGNYSAGVKMIKDRHGSYGIVDAIRGQWGATRREETIRQTAELDGDDVEVIVEIEGGSGGKESGENTVRNLAGHRITTYHPTGDKPARAYGLASQVGAGNVWCLKRPWTKALLEELRYFPHGKYDDQVDAASAAFARLARKKVRVGGWR